jgi:glutathione synthase/RimK-type ligase-like ATP-grasp enzyme
VILAVTHRGDDHAPPVLDALARLGAPALSVDLADFPGRASLALSAGEPGEEGMLHTAAGPVPVAEVTAVWWRRPRDFEPHPELAGADADFARRQTGEALSGLWASLPVRWVNDPWLDDRASHKAYQLALAERLGLAVLPTLVTNEPDRARAFLARHGKVVHKALHATPGDWRTTRLVGAEEAGRLDDVRFAPVVFQRHVEGVDVRVTAVGERLFAADVDARATDSPDDFRPVFHQARVAPAALPAALEAKLRALLRALGLAYAAVDLRRTPQGAYHFLEVNPSGQFRFLEERLGLPITQALAELLAGR